MCCDNDAGVNSRGLPGATLSGKRSPVSCLVQAVGSLLGDADVGWRGGYGFDCAEITSLLCDFAVSKRRVGMKLHGCCRQRVRKA